MSDKLKNSESNIEDNIENKLDLNELADATPLDHNVEPDFDNLEEIPNDEILNIEAQEEVNENELLKDSDLDDKARVLPDHELASFVIGHSVENPIATEFDDKQALKNDTDEQEFLNNPVVEEPEIDLDENKRVEEPTAKHQELNEEPIKNQEEPKDKVEELPNKQDTVELNNDKSTISENSFPEKYANLKKVFAKPDKKPEKLSFKLDTNYDNSYNLDKISEFENRVYEKAYNKTEFDTWLLKNYKLYKFKGTAKKILEEYKNMSMREASSEDLFTLKVKFQKAFIPSMFYDAQNGIVARKLKDYLVTEYEGDLVPYSYLKEKQVEYLVEDLIYEDAINQVNLLEIKKKENDEVKNIYYDQFCYIDSCENLNGSQKLKKAYYRSGLFSFILGLIIFALSVLALIKPVVEQMRDIIDLEKLAMPLFICGVSLCFILIFYNCFKGPLSSKIKELTKLKSKYLVFIYNNKKIDNAIYSILHAKVRKTNTKSLSKEPKALCFMDYDIISSIPAAQIQAAKEQRQARRTSNSLVKWMGRVYSVLAATLFAGSVAILVDVMTSVQIISKNESSEAISLGLTYLAALGISVVFGLLFLVSRNKPILRKALYYLHGLVVLVATIIIKMFIL